MDRYIIHQVSSVHTKLICERLGIDPAQGAAHLPAATATSARPPSRSRSPASQARAAGRRARAVHGHRIGAEHELHRDRLVSPPVGARRRRAARARGGASTRRGRARSTSPGHDGVTHAGTCSTARPADRRSRTIVCVHGNPTWSYLWRDVLDRLGDRYRVVAVDQLGMGFSERTGRAALRRAGRRPRRRDRRARRSTDRW